MNNKKQFLLILFFISFLVPLVAEPILTIDSICKEREIITLTPISAERIFAEQLVFIAKKQKFARCKKAAYIGGALVGAASFLYWLKPRQEVPKEVSEAEEAAAKAQYHKAFAKHVNPSIWDRGEQIFQNAFLFPIMYFVINGVLSWGHQDFLPIIMEKLGSTSYDCANSVERFLEAYKNFKMIAQKIQIGSMSKAQEASYKQALFCAHNSLVLYAEVFIARLLVELQFVKPEHQAFVQEVSESIKSTMLVMHSLYDVLKTDYHMLGGDLLHNLCSTQELLSAQQKRISLYV